MCQIHNQILSRKAELDLTNEQIAQRMGAYLNKPMSASAVQKYFSDGAGIPLESVGAFLSALGFKLVGHDQAMVDPAELSALRLLARKGLDD